MADGDPFKKYGGQQIDDGDPFKKYGGTTIAEPPKKKESLVYGFGTGSISPYKSSSELDTRPMIEGIHYSPDVSQPAQQKAKSNIPDPVADIINPLEEKYNIASTNYKNRYPTNRLVSESTAQQPMVKSLVKQADDKQITKDYKQATDEYQHGIDAVEKNIFPSPLDARDYLQMQVKEHGVDAIKDNKTAQLAYNKWQQYEDVKKQYQQEPNLRQLAVDLQRQADPNFDKQVLQLEGGENDRKLDVYENVLPGVVQGRLIDRMLQDKNIQALAQEDEGARKQVEELQNGGVYKSFPEYGENVVRNAMSRAYREEKANHIINPIFDKSSYLNDLADRLFQDQPELKAIADKMKGHWEGKIDTPGLVDEFATGARKTFQQMGETFKDVLGAGTPERERIKEGLQNQFGQVSSGISGGWKKLGEAANMAGMFTAMAASGSPLRGAGISPKIVNGVVTGGTFFDEQKNAATMKYPGEPWKANLEALAMTGLYMGALKNGVPAGKIAGVVEKAQPELDAALKNLSAEATEAEIKNATSNALQKAVAGTFKGAGEMTALTTINAGLDRALGLDGQTYSKYHPDNELADVAQSMLVGLAAPQLLSEIGNRKAVSNSLYDMASYPERYKNSISMEGNKGAFDKQLENIDFLSGLKKELDAKRIDEPNQKIFLLEALNEKLAKEKLEGGQKSPAGAFTRQTEQELQGYQDVQDRILNGEDVAGKEIGPNEISQPIELNPELPEGYQLPDQQKTEPEVNIPKSPTGQTNETPQEPTQATEPIPAETKGQPTEGTNTPLEPPKEPAGMPTEESGKTGIKNAISRETRLNFELPKVELPKIGTDIERINEGKKAVDSGEINPEEVVSKVLEGKGRIGMQPKEAHAMIYYTHQLGRADELLQKQQSLENLEPGERQKIISQRLQLSDLMDRATEANMLAGTAQSEAFSSRGIIVDSGFNPSREKSIIKEAYGGTIPKDVKEQLDSVIKERDEAVQARTKLEEELRQKEAELQVALMKKGRSSAPRTASDYSAKRKGLLEDLKKAKEEHEQWLRDQGIQKAGFGFTLTGKMIRIIGEYAKTFIDQGAEKLSEVIDKVHEELKDLFPGIGKNDIRDAIASYHSEKLETKAAGLEKQAAEGEIQPSFDKLKPKFQKDNRWVKANQRVANAEYKIKGIKKKAMNSDKSMLQRGFNWGSRLFRASVLSGYNVLYKLAAAAAIGGVAKRIPEQAIGQMWSTIFNGIAKKAPIEGFTNAKAEATFAKEFFNPKKFVKNSWEILKGNESDLTRRIGEPYNEPQKTVVGKVADRVLSLPTDLHQVVKDPVKRATFEASVKNGMVWAEKNGLDITDPLVINSIETAAYKRANYEIFLEKNKLNEAFQNFKNKMEKSGNIGAAGKLLADFLIPVSTVPTNIARRLLSTSPLGLIRGGVKVTEAYRKGIENLNTEQADAVMRQLKQGSLGTALWLIGWFGASSYGGLYSQYDPNKKRKEGELASDQMEINGKMVPKPVQHALPLEIIQWAATMRHIYDNYKENKGASDFNATWKAGLGAIGSLAEQIPIIETPVHLINAASDPYEGKKFEEDMKRRIEPQILRETGVVGTQTNELQRIKNKYSDSENIFKNDLEKTIGRDISPSEFKKYKEARDSRIAENIETLYNKGINGKKFSELSDAEQRDEISYIKTQATEDAKDEIFGEIKPTNKEKREHDKLIKSRHKTYK